MRRAAIARRDDAAIQVAMSDRWLSDVTLFGSAKAVREGTQAWQATGVKTGGRRAYPLYRSDAVEEAPLGREGAIG